MYEVEKLILASYLLIEHESNSRYNPNIRSQKYYQYDFYLNDYEKKKLSPRFKYRYWSTLFQYRNSATCVQKALSDIRTNQLYEKNDFNDWL
jgi:hypothetical protein